MLSLENEFDSLLDESYSSVILREETEFDRLASPFEKSIVLVGAGNFGKKVLACLRKDGIEPLAFADNNPVLQGNSIDGINVLSWQQAAEKYNKSAVFVVTIWNTAHSFNKSREELKNLGCINVISSIPLRWKYEKELLPFFWLDLPNKIIKKSSSIKSVHSYWSDEFSRREYLAQLKFRILGDFDSLSEPVVQESYFPEDIFDLLPGENFIDCGAFDGITIRRFLARQNGLMGNIVAYEPDPLNFDLLMQNSSLLASSIRKRILLLPFAVGAKNGKVSFDATGTMGSSISINGKIEVECITLDKNLTELQLTPTYIKMDIEGGEVDALIGGHQIIQKNLPILAVCIYHRFDDIWRIPSVIKSISNEYQLFLRPHELEGWQLVCYAVPKYRLKTTYDNR
jgi:FkbM family methyltransferase